MKVLLIIIFSLYYGLLFGQWIEKDSSATIEEFIDLSDWIYFDGGDEISCALPFNDSNFKTTFYKRLDRTDLVFCKIENTETGSYELIFFRLRLDDQDRLCWRRDLLGMGFNKENVLQKFLFFDENGEVCEPQEFTISVK